MANLLVIHAAAFVSGANPPVVHNEASRGMQLHPGALTGSSAAPKPIAKKPRVILCAPSNAAVDELVRRLSRGIEVVDGFGERKLFKPNILRMGNQSRIAPDCILHSLDYQLDREFEPLEPAINKLKETGRRLHVCRLLHSLESTFVSSH
jgi:superfamily I DNA and/or RNA helicase